MDRWALTAWDNDAAALWFCGTFRDTGLADYVGQTLERNAHEYPEQIARPPICWSRWVTSMFGQSMTWRNTCHWRFLSSKS